MGVLQMHAHTVEKRLSYRRERRVPDEWVALPSETAARSNRVESRRFGRSASGTELNSREVARKVWHMLPGMLILGVPLLQSFPLVAYHLPALIVGFTAILAILSLVNTQHFARPGERDWAISVLGYAATALVPLTVFPGHVELALAALVILAFGDGAAALAGLALRGPELPWNSGKTVAGTLAFMLCAAPCATWIYWSMARPSASFEMALVNGTAAAAVAALAESIRSPINDNVRVGAAATAMLLLLHWLTIG